jgi:hypothetical protein
MWSVYTIIKYKQMAINVDTVYRTVLLITNQQERGYVTPDEFNKIADQVQLGIFEKYMSDLNQQTRIPENDTEYANRVKNIDEKLGIFKKINTPSYIAGGFQLDSLQDFYRFGSVIVDDYIEAQMVDNGEIYRILRSPLIAPTRKQPLFTLQENKVRMYPSSIVNGVQITYLKKPVSPAWLSTSHPTLNVPIYDAVNSVNFELHASEQTDLIHGILLYLGIIIKDPTLIEVAAQKIVQEDNNEKS